MTDKLTIIVTYMYRVGKNGLYWGVDKFTMVNGRKACDMSIVAEFCLEKSIKLLCQCI